MKLILRYWVIFYGIQEPEQLYAESYEEFFAKLKARIEQVGAIEMLYRY